MPILTDNLYQQLTASFEFTQTLPPPSTNGAGGVLWKATGRGRLGKFWLDVPGAAQFAVGNGDRILVQRAGGEPGFIERIGRTTPYAALLYQRDLLALHASAVLVPQHNGDKPGFAAILLAGKSGAGKSTLLAGLALHGAVPLADDLVPLGLDSSGHPVTIANPGQVQIWPDVRQNLGLSEDRMMVRAKGSPGIESYPLQAIYWLGVHSEERVDQRSIEGMKRFEVIGKLTYNTQIADALLDRQALFAFAAAVTDHIPLVRILRPRQKWVIDELIQCILEGPAG